MDGDIAATVSEVYRAESRRVLATLIKLLKDFDLAEEALHDAFATAVEQWPLKGIPANPRAWLVSTGRFKAVDAIRRRARHDAKLAVLAAELDRETAEHFDAQTQRLESGVFETDSEGRGTESARAAAEPEDDRLRLIFICCHPSIPPDSQIALTLREVCGLTTEEIAAAYFTSPATLAKRIVRAKTAIRDAGIPYEIPPPAEFPARLGAVLRIVYLVFNEAYSASAGESLTRADLAAESIRLARLLLELLPHPETEGLLALLLLQDSRRAARTSADGDLILLEDQDRTLWNRGQIAEGIERAERAMCEGRGGYYVIQAAIAALHAESPGTVHTDWEQIAALYKILMETAPTPVVELNYAVAVSMTPAGPEKALSLVLAILERGDLGDFHLAYAVLADLYKRLGQKSYARQAYERALSLTKQDSERRFIVRRIAELLY